jgi:hypothetical protein
MVARRVLYASIKVPANRIRVSQVRGLLNCPPLHCRLTTILQDKKLLLQSRNNIPVFISQRLTLYNPIFSDHRHKDAEEVGDQEGT